MPVDNFYWSKPWRKFRAHMLALRPICEVNGCNDKATQVDHIRAIRKGGALYDPANSRCYCKSHHSMKTASVDMVLNANSRLGVRVLGCDEHGQPLDPAHHWNKK